MFPRPRQRCVLPYTGISSQTTPEKETEQKFHWPDRPEEGRFSVVLRAPGAYAMNKSTIGILLVLLGAVGAAWGQTALPTFYSGPWSGATLPAGWTAGGLRSSDYADNYDGVDGNAAGFDHAGDWIKINFNGSPSTVTYWSKGNSLSGNYTFKVQESANGSTWTDVAVFNSGNPIPNSPATKYTNNLLSTSRYVQFLYVTKAAGNVGLDGVTVSGPSVPTVTFDPAGNQSIPVSNLLTLAVTVTPSGSGIQNWSLLTGYAGASSLAGGVFQMTPAAGDANKTFTLTVVATNAVGTASNSVQISVTPYTPPVPVVTFSPAPPYEIMATETQKLGVAVSPAGSGIQSWTLLPAYAGSATLVGTNFTFVPAQTDGPNTYTLSVIATNVHGSSTGTASIAVAEYVTPPPPGSYIITFEDATKGTYAAGNVTLNGREWELAETYIGNLETDRKFGGKAARVRYSDTLLAALTSQSPLLSGGVGWISLWYAAYGNDVSNAPAFAIEISESLAGGWIAVDSFDAAGVSNLTYRSVDVDVNIPIYVRIRAVSGRPEGRANIDNITITPYTSGAGTPYEAFLLQYNVTPGDPGTAEGEDLDGDGATNLQEFNASPKTNPYDEASKP